MSLLLPEYRQIELYSKKRVLPVVEDATAELAQVKAAVTSLVWSFAALDASVGDGPAGNNPTETWAKYLRLPRHTALEKLTAEVYRALRPFHAAATHDSGRIEIASGLVKASSTIGHTALSIRATRVGMRLLESFVTYRLAADTEPYPDAYVEAMLCRYWADIYAEIRWFYDEDRVLYQFRDPYGMNRHFRFDCDNPRFDIKDGMVQFDVGPTYRDTRRYPIDFYIVVEERLHIIPVEALTAWALAVDDLPRWAARLPDGLTLPASYRPRFTREEMVPGLPMT